MKEKPLNDHSHMERAFLPTDEIKVEVEKNLSANNILTLFQPYILIILVVLLFSRREEYGYKGTADTVSRYTTLSVQKVMKNHDIKRAIHSVCTYLDEKEQIPIHTLTGVLEIINTMQKLLDNSYRIQGLPYSTCSNKIEKKLGIITALKEHAHEEDKNLLEAVEGIVTTADKIKRVIQRTEVVESTNKSEN